MERAVAIKRLGKLLGKNLGYRVDPKAPDQEQRKAAQAELLIQREIKKSLDEALNARRREILQADTEYQRLKVECEQASKNCSELSGIMRHHRITVGISNGMFFAIRAEGDSWEQVIEKLTKKETLR